MLAQAKHTRRKRNQQLDHKIRASKSLDENNDGLRGLGLTA